MKNRGIILTLSLQIRFLREHWKAIFLHVPHDKYA